MNYKRALLLIMQLIEKVTVKRTIMLDWISPRMGLDWKDQNIVNAINWLISKINFKDQQNRWERVEAIFNEGLSQIKRGEQAKFFDSEDMIFWYIFQAKAYAQNRHQWYEPEAFRIVPIFNLLGGFVDYFNEISGANDRAYELMTTKRKKPDDTIFELLIAGMYKREGISEVSFISEKPGVTKTPDLLLKSERGVYEVECKRVNRTNYEKEEEIKIDLLMRFFYESCKKRGVSLFMELDLNKEVSSIDKNYILEKLDLYFDAGTSIKWSDNFSKGKIGEIDRSLINRVLSSDDVFYGSSRMVQLLLGAFDSDYIHHMDADWTPSQNFPLFATELGWCCVFSWKNTSEESQKRRARHFKSILGRASEQFSRNAPGVIHIGCESIQGNSVQEKRRGLNLQVLRDFNPRGTALSAVYMHYFFCESTIDKNESFALSETVDNGTINSDYTPLNKVPLMVGDN